MTIVVAEIRYAMVPFVTTNPIASLHVLHKNDMIRTRIEMLQYITVLPAYTPFTQLRSVLVADSSVETIHQVLQVGHAV